MSDSGIDWMEPESAEQAEQFARGRREHALELRLQAQSLRIDARRLERTAVLCDTKAEEAGQWRP